MKTFSEYELTADRNGKEIQKNWKKVLFFTVLISVISATYITLNSGDVKIKNDTQIQVQLSSPQPLPEYEEFAVENLDNYTLSTNLVTCASDQIEAMVADSTSLGGVFSPGIEPIRGSSAVWRWEMVGVGEIVIVAVNLERFDYSARELLASPGAVDALGDARGVLDRSASSVAGSWWVGIGTAFSVAVPLTIEQTENASAVVAGCLNKRTSNQVE